MIGREIDQYVQYVLDKYPVITITGPRQSGKTYLVRHLFPDLSYVNLEDLEKRDFAIEDPKRFLGQYSDGAIIDEAQYAPELFSYIQVQVDEALLDRPNKQAKRPMFVLTGSHQFLLLKNISQSLSGRTTLINLLPFSLSELNASQGNPKLRVLLDDKNCYEKIIHYGFYPGIFEKNIHPNVFYRDYVKTYIERDLRDISNIHNISLFRKFMQLCAGRVGQVLVLDNIGSDLGVSAKTVSDWLSILETSYIVFLLEPYHANINKRLIKAPKIYFYDVGLASYLLDIESHEQIVSHPLRGSLFENLVVIEALKFRFNQGKNNNLNFYRDKSKEVDLLFRSAQHVLPMEIKAAGTVHASMFDNLKYFEKLFPDLPHGKALIYAGSEDQDRSQAFVTNPWGLAGLLGKVSKGFDVLGCG